jgi:hypothetical protein
MKALVLVVLLTLSTERTFFLNGTLLGKEAHTKRATLCVRVALSS